jgi:hypothetical protein
MDLDDSLKRRPHITAGTLGFFPLSAHAGSSGEFRSGLTRFCSISIGVVVMGQSFHISFTFPSTPKTMSMRI